MREISSVCRWSLGTAECTQVSPGRGPVGERRSGISYKSQTFAGRKTGAGRGQWNNYFDSKCSYNSANSASAVFQRNYTVYVNRVPVADADLMATNGVVHAMNKIITPLRKYHEHL